MKQVVQNYKTGKLTIDEVPSPKPQREEILIKNEVSLISAGTERTKLETARMNIVEKAIFRLDLMKIVMNNIKQEGLIFTIKKALNKLDTPISLGYSCAGRVIELGEDVSEFKVGDRVACVGETYATHSEINAVPCRFSASIPSGVDSLEASFVGIGAIALNSIELAQVREHELIAVIGLGLIGQVVTQILKTKGCKVIGIELDESKLSLAKKLGMDASANPLYDGIEAIVNDFSSNKGIDAVFITAASTNNLPIEMAGKISRDKGRVVLVGAMPIIIPRKDYYEKELFFTVSRGFGMGLYYKEEKNRWYAYNYKPITVKQNMNNFLLLLKDKKIKVEPLVSHRFKISEAQQTYELIRNKKNKYLGIVFDYAEAVSREQKIILAKKSSLNLVNIGFIGAGSFAQGYLLPILKRHNDVRLIGVATAKGINSKNVAKKFGFQYCATDYNEILNDEKINALIIATRHNLHASIVIEALKRKKHIFVEKPLCLSEEELKKIISAYNEYNSTSALMVGFNRRFSPFIIETKKFFKNRTGPLMLSYRINAGSLPLDHWIHNVNEGGGRIIGEMCHFVDLFQFITQSTPQEIFAISLQKTNSIVLKDNIVISIKFSDNSLATIIYNSIGDISYPRERIEIFGEDSVAVVDNFKKAYFTRKGVTQTMHRAFRDMGYNDEIVSFISSSKDEKKAPISFYEIVLTTITTFKIIESLKMGVPVKIDSSEWHKLVYENNG